jgi:hypothetical protein
VSEPKKKLLRPDVDEVGSFWVVTTPTDVSTLGDILFEADVPKMMLQSLGGLREEQIVGFYRSREHAEYVARQALTIRQQGKLYRAMVAADRATGGES